VNLFKYLFIALALNFIALNPHKAHSHEHIPFYATNNAGKKIILMCVGPWFRTPCGFNDECSIGAGADDDNFYSAEVTTASPYGHWRCTLKEPECPSHPGTPACEACCVDFTLTKGDDSVYLTIENETTIIANLSSGSDTSTTLAALGDDNTKPKRDTDTWSIQGTEGDNVVITLEVDPSAGHDGSEATLILLNGNSTIESKTDALPIEISAALPSDGEYQLVVSQNDIPEDVRFRGRYILSVKSDSGNVQDIKPSEDVEQ